MPINAIRIINISMQTVYLSAMLLIGIWIGRRMQPSPICKWFMAFTAALWLWVSGRFAESVVYLFFPTNNDAYVFAANYQYLGITTAAASYAIWNLYLAGYDNIAESVWVRVFLFACPVVVCTLVFTNHYHHLFYTKLVMGEQVVHGKLFAPMVLWGYLFMLVGYLLSLRNVVKTGADKLKRFFLISTFPLLPGAAILVRSLSGVDLFDYTPVVMAISCYCVYLVAFKNDYINILPTSLESAVRHSPRPVGVYNTMEKRFTYLNFLAETEYCAAFDMIPAATSLAVGKHEATLGGHDLRINISRLTDHELMIAVTDQTESNARLRLLVEQMAQYAQAKRKLDDENRNIDAYLSSLDLSDDLKKRKEMADNINGRMEVVFGRIKKNLLDARSDPKRCEPALRETMMITKESIDEIREVVAKLKEH